MNYKQSSPKTITSVSNRHLRKEEKENTSKYD